MTRLYYEEISTGGIAALPKRSAKIATTGWDYGEKVAKLVPAEILAAFIGLVGLVPLIKYESARPWMYAIGFLVCLILTPLYLNHQAKAGKPKRNHLILSTFAFVLWAYATVGMTVIPQWHDSAIASILLLLFSLISALIPLDK